MEYCKIKRKIPRKNVYLCTLILAGWLLVVGIHLDCMIL